MPCFVLKVHSLPMPYCLLFNISRDSNLLARDKEFGIAGTLFLPQNC